MAITKVSTHQRRVEPSRQEDFLRTYSGNLYAAILLSESRLPARWRVFFSRQRANG